MANTYRLFTTKTVSDEGASYTEDGVAASSTDTYYSNKMAPGSDDLGFTLQTTGTLTGTFTLWLSDKDHPSLADDADWVQAAGPTFTNPAGSTTKVKYGIEGLEFAWARVKYVNASGTGNLLGYQSRESR